MTSRRVLLVEDDAAVREGLSLALRHQGHQVVVVESGEQALENVCGHPGRTWSSWT